MQLKEFDIILKKNSKNPISKIIQKVTKDKYSHSSIYIGNYHIIESTPTGVKVNNFNSSLSEFDLYRYAKPLNPTEKQRIVEFLQKSINTKYDFIEVFLQLFGIKKRQDNKYICISLLMEAFKYAGVEIDEWKVGFKQVSDSKYFKQIKIIVKIFILNLAILFHKNT